MLKVQINSREVIHNINPSSIILLLLDILISVYPTQMKCSDWAWCWSTKFSHINPLSFHWISITPMSMPQDFSHGIVNAGLKEPSKRKHYLWHMNFVYYNEYLVLIKERRVRKEFLKSSYPAGELPGELFCAEFDDLKVLFQSHQFHDSSPSQLFWGNAAQKKQTQHLPQ